MAEFKLNTIPEAVEAIKQGEIVIVVDDEDRENEGDFIAAAELVTPKWSISCPLRTGTYVCPTYRRAL
jgi:3,4-dihydroxy-2-butanone 4-phosphate synthase